MKKLFYIGIIGLTLFEIFNVYFIMPMPGSQRMNSIDVAYFLYGYRWEIRILFGLFIVLGMRAVFLRTTRAQEKEIKIANEYFIKGDKDKALTMYQMLAKTPENIPSIHSNYHRLLLDLGKDKEAEDYVAASKTFRKRKRKWIPAVVLIFPIAAIYMFNFRMSADSMFEQPEKLTFKPKSENVLNDSAIVVGLEHNGQTKAYPIRYIGYHHQVQDSVGGLPVIITYCTVCRTGRVFEPVVKGHREKFRLVGMDHFNAMFEDASTGSWWRQVNGEAITGQLKGETLPEVESFQMTVGKLFELHPDALVMQMDEASKDSYDSLAKYEKGKSKGDLTRKDSLSWKDKSWVIGVVVGKASKAYDWNEFKITHVVNDKIGSTPVALVLADDGQSFAAFERPSEADMFFVRHDTIFTGDKKYAFSGKDISSEQSLRKLKSYQEFWHSWKTFHPDTDQYK